jgi:hypothetical protein
LQCYFYHSGNPFPAAAKGAVHIVIGRGAAHFSLIDCEFSLRYEPRSAWAVMQPSGAGHINFRLASLKRLTLLVYTIGGTLS